MEDKKTKLKILPAKFHRPQISDELTQANEAMRREINERKRIQGELEQVKENLSRAQEIAHLGSWQLDIAKNKLWWSDETYQMFGVASGTPMTYEKFLAHVHPEHKTGVEEPWLAALKGKPYDIEHRIIVADKVKWVRGRADVMQKLRSLLKKTGEEFVPLKIKDIIEEVLKLTKSEFVIKNISLSKQLEKKLPKVNGDRVQLQQVFLNLIINAIDATKGSKVKNLHISIDKHDTESIIVCLRDIQEWVLMKRTKTACLNTSIRLKKKGWGFLLIKRLSKLMVGIFGLKITKKGEPAFL